MSQTSQYQFEAQQTERKIDYECNDRCMKDARMLHGVLGVVSEAGELADIFKKHIYYNKAIDRVNVVEELGDLLWYIALLANCVDINLEEVMAINVAKLRTRYPNMFTEYDAQARGRLDAERSVLESGVRTADSERETS